MEAQDVTLTVEGVLERIFVEAEHDAHAEEHDEAAEAAIGESASEIVSLVDVDGTLYELPEELPVEGVTGDDVVLTLEAAPGLTKAEALRAATAPEPPVDSEPADAEPTATIVTVVPAEDDLQASTEETLLAVTLGGHSLTVLPVYFGGSVPSMPVSDLASTAKATASYWNAQSGGRLSVQSSVREWKSISDPGSCDTTKIWNAATVAHGSPAVSATQHVLVYFPKRSDCGGWAGMASVGGGKIWVNGFRLTDVFAHELGHNLGLGHANTMTCTVGGGRVPMATPVTSSCTQQAYGDWADVMGIGSNMATGNLNTAFADYLGFASVTAVPSSPTTTSNVNVAPLAAFSSMRALKVGTSEGTVYLDYRPAVSPDTRKTAWAGVQVHLRRTENGIPTAYLLDMQAASTSSFAAANLPVGRTWDVPGTSARFGVTATGSTAAVSVGSTSAPISTDDGIERYVTRVYQDLFHRAPDPAGLAHWSSALRNGTPRIAVANSITYSTEYRSRLITASYKEFLGRAPEPAGLQHWLTYLAAGSTIQQMEGGFLASAEYYQKAGSTDAGWVTKLYKHVLGRTPAPSEVSYWVQVLRTNGGDRGQVAKGFLLSTERLTAVVDGYYRELLGRGIDPTGRQGWVSAIQRGARVEAIIGGIIASDEYFRK